ncbi:MAG: hypothetical protein OEV49_15900 [candidate division Zixibacteria bacterium]|nr:hypothetical protein [candidate division Zixibacteria bacterium]MDH3937443.1 hypothetical protein [candidate division Zixibacteria bacterium]MDH4034773.1 hypothetical protein [candidate division Zixibacteria bacterium]
MIMRRLGVLLPALMVLALIGGCASDKDSEAPKKTVIALFGAMEKDDQAALLYVLDLPELMMSLNEDYALQTDSPRVFTNPEQILDDLTGEGKTKKTWFALQRIISGVNLTGEETATVDVTFVDKEKSKGYMTRFGLHKVNGKWKIYSFKTVSGS